MHAPIMMSVIANDATNWFIGFWRRRELVTMATNTRRLPASVTAPVARFRTLNIVSSDWSHEEWAVMLVNVAEPFVNIVSWRQRDFRFQERWLCLICQTPVPSHEWSALSSRVRHHGVTPVKWKKYIKNVAEDEVDSDEQSSPVLQLFTPLAFSRTDEVNCVWVKMQRSQS